MVKTAHRMKKVGKLIAAMALSATLASPIFFNLGHTSFAEDYANDYNAAELQEEMENLNLQIAEEGVVLLKNKNNALPFARNDRHVTVFHSCWDPWSKEIYAGNVVGDMEIGCSGNGGSGGVLPSDPKSVYDGLEDNGFEINKAVKNLYEKYKVDYDHVNRSEKHTSRYAYDDRYINTTDGPNLKILKKAEKSLYNYSDAAIITISRQEGEGTDIIGTSVFFDADTQREKGVEHYLQLNTGEKELIEYAKENFQKVVVVINTGMQIELGELEDDDGIDAILWSGIAGENGLKAIGSVLSGAANPSGRLPDTWAADLTKDPTYINFGKGDHLDEVMNSPNVKPGQYKGNSSINGGGYGMYGVDYSEGIYVGYRFYETADTIGYFDENGGYYNRTNGVVYPFGYGLSYTEFKQEIVSNSTTGDTITLKVKVSNIGNASGKEVVQVYYNPPYTAGGIEKSSANLVAFAKTDVLRPGKDQTVELTFNKRDMASYDYNDANKDGHKGYELEKGDYIISINKNSHTTWQEITYKHAATTNYDTDAKTGKKIEQLFSGEGNIYNLDRREFTKDGSGVNYMHRSLVAEDGTKTENGFKATFPQIRLGESKKTSADGTGNAYPDGYAHLKPGYDEIFFYSLRGKDPIGIDDDYKKEYEQYGVVYDWLRTEKDCEGWTQTATRAVGEKAAIQLKQMIGIELDDNVLTEKDTPLAATGGAFAGKTGKEAWKIFMDQLTYDELATLVANAYFKTEAIEAIGKPATDDNDGPAQLRNHNSTEYSYGFASACTIAATWNEELSELYGKLMGEWALQHNMTGWYGPSMNIHRSPFCGRNYEYYSEDPVLSGNLGAAAVKGAHSKGLISYIKHFAMNNQETDRANVIVWSDEQTMREIYIKSFEKSIKYSDSLGIMLSMNNLGLFQAASNYNFDVKLLREEWGYKGIVISDYGSGKGVQYNLRCQVLPLASDTKTVAAKWDAEKGYPVYNGQAAYTEWYAARTTAQYMLYTMCKSNAVKTKADLSVFVPEGEAIEVNIYLGQNHVYIPMSADGVSKVYKDFTLKNVTYVDQANYDSRNGGEAMLFFSGYKINAKGEIVAFNSTMGFTAPGTSEFIMTGITEEGDEVQRTLIINAIASLELGNMHAVEGAPFSTTMVVKDVPNMTFDHVEEGWWYDTEIPGMTMDRQGNLTGTPTKAGTYSINFCLYNEEEDDVYYMTNIPFVVHEKGWAPTPEFRVNEGILQYRIMEGSWQDIGVVASVEKIATNGLVDTYQVTFSNGESFTYTVTNGANGADGVDGAPGKDGTNGKDGVDGAPGKDGTNGKDGKDGVNGTNGTSGTDGKDGKDGKGIASATINENGELVIKYTDGTEVNLGVVKNVETSGCGSSIEVAAPLAVSAIILLAGVVMFTALRRKKNND